MFVHLIVVPTGTALQTAQLTENTINNIYKTVSPSVVRITSSVQSGNGNQGNQGNTNQTTTIGDIITGIDGHPVSSVPDLTSYLNSKQPGDVVSLTIIRNGNQQNGDLTLAAWAGGSTTNNN
jgi:PDZ domain-containing secreted protein